MRARTLIVALVLLSAGCTMWKEKQSPGWKSATGAEQFERLLWGDIQAGKWTDVEKHLGGTFVASLPIGTRDRAGAIEYWKKQGISQLSLGDFATQSNGNDIIVTYTAQLAGSAAPLRMMTVWQQTKGGDWIAIAHAESSSSTAASVPQ